MKKIILLMVLCAFIINAHAQKKGPLSFEKKIELIPNSIKNDDAPALKVFKFDDNVTGYVIEKKTRDVWQLLTADGQEGGKDIIDYDIDLSTFKKNIYRIRVFYLSGKRKIFFFRT